jgi:DNA-binding NarL/FixJ family response regulator
MTGWQPLFATREALRIADVRQLLADAGVASDLCVVFPEELERALAGAGDCLVILDGRSLPHPDVLRQLRQSSPGSRFVIWADQPTPEVLLATMECGLHGLLSTQLPPQEAAYALARICQGERLVRFDSDPDPLTIPRKKSRRVAEDASFGAQWMLHGADSQGRET